MRLKVIRVHYAVMKGEFERVLQSRGMGKEDAELSARLLADTSLEGVYTHGAHRFPTLIDLIDRGRIDIRARAQRLSAHGSLERWDGMGGVGNLNAHRAMGRAIELARLHTVGVVALRNTNHWMRAGSYGIMAAEAGCIGLLWTNTIALMSPWGGVETKVGNNPLVVAIPSKEGIILVDMAMSLFSYGKMETYARSGRALPVIGGWDEEGALTDDAGAILKSRRPLPTGLWKGTSLAIVLDLMAAALSGGLTTYDLTQSKEERGVSQVFVAIDLASFDDRSEIERRISATLADLEATTPLEEGEAVRWPAQRRLAIREENLRLGIPTDEAIWKQILAL